LKELQDDTTTLEHSFKLQGTYEIESEVSINASSASKQSSLPVAKPKKIFYEGDVEVVSEPTDAAIKAILFYMQSLPTTNDSSSSSSSSSSIANKKPWNIQSQFVDSACLSTTFRPQQLRSRFESDFDDCKSMGERSAMNRRKRSNSMAAL